MTLSQTSQAFLDRYAAVHGQLPGADLPWLSALRDKAASVFGKTGIPTVRDEDWRYTNLRPLEGFDLSADPGAGVSFTKDTLPTPFGSGVRLVFVDGSYREELCDLKAGTSGLRIAGLSTMLNSDQETLEPRLADLGDGSPMLALNGAFLEDGYVIELAAGADAGAPIEIIFWDTGGETATVRQPRNMIVAGEDSRVDVLERHLGAGASQQFFNGATMITAAGGALIRHHRVQAQGAGSVHVNTIRACVNEGARYESFVLASGGGIARDEIQLALMAERAETRLNGIYLGDGDQVVDNTTVVRHAAPDTTSRELYKGALRGSARAVFQGNIRVERGADQSDGRLNNRTLLLSDDAEIDSKPQLEIYADEVQCAHGATAGELDDEALFYIRSRGIDVEEARRLLVEAFLNEVIDGVDVPEIAELMRGQVSEWLGREEAVR